MEQQQHLAWKMDGALEAYQANPTAANWERYQAAVDDWYRAEDESPETDD